MDRASYGDVAQDNSCCTLHHANCGCPWTISNSAGGAVAAAAAATSAAAQVLDAVLQEQLCLRTNGRLPTTKPLRIAYVVPHHNVTGGMKTICLHVQLLRGRGHHVVAVYRPAVPNHGADAAGAGAMPPWSGVHADTEVLLGPDVHLAQVYPVQELNVIVCGMFHQVPELLVGTPVPVVYFEQGHEWLFGDPVRFRPEHGYAAQDALFHTVCHLPVVLASVSSPVTAILQREFGRVAVEVPNAVDCDAFCPVTSDRQGSGQEACAGVGITTVAVPPASGTESGVGQVPLGSAGAAHRALGGSAGAVPVAPSTNGEPDACAARCQGEGELGGSRTYPCPARVLLVGNPRLPLKGFDTAVEVLTAVAAALLTHNTLATSPPAPAGSHIIAPHTTPGSAAADAALDLQRGPLVAEELHASVADQPTARAESAPVVLHVSWVCQHAPGPHLLHLLLSCPGLHLSTHVSPPQDQLPDLYRHHDVFLFTSRYEAWGLPVLEAMASGVAVVACDNPGLRSFATPGEDCLVAAAGDMKGLVCSVLAILSDRGLQERLVQAGRRTALKHSTACLADRLVSLLYAVSACTEEFDRLRTHPLVLPTIQRACHQAVQAGQLSMRQAP